MKIALVFSGQGAQYSGMGKELYDHFATCRQTFDEADSALPFKISDICFNENEANKLNDTAYCQPAMLTLSTACYRLLAESKLKFDYMAGLSLGEYSALTCAGAFGFSDAVSLVRKRGQFMLEAVTIKAGAMSAILGADNQTVELVCKDAREAYGYVVCANYNAPGQVVIAGETRAVEEAEKIAISYGAKRAIRLNVSGPFHTEMLNSAVPKLNVELDKISINNLSTPVISNVDTIELSKKEDVSPTLLKQIVSPVKWEQTVDLLIKKGVDTFIELGAGKTLLGFIKKIDRNVNLLNIEDTKSYEKTMDFFNKQ